MLLSRRTLCAGSFAAGPITCFPEPTLPPAATPRPALATLVRRSEAANDALMRGDVGRYRELVTLAEDFLLMSPFGGKPSGRPKDEAAWASLGRFFANGSLTQEVVQAWEGADMAMLAVIERAKVEVAGLPAQDWALRVTLVYRRTSDGWDLLHRHADPLAHGITLHQAAVLGRGQEA